MSKPSTVTLRLPRELKERLENAAHQQGVSLNQFALYILSGEVARLEAIEEKAWETLDKKYLSHDDTLEAAQNVLKKVKAQKVPTWDKIR